MQTHARSRSQAPGEPACVLGGTARRSARRSRGPCPRPPATGAPGRSTTARPAGAAPPPGANMAA
eukprot:5637474-Pyramimonas_sp.AAC.1